MVEDSVPNFQRKVIFDHYSQIKILKNVIIIAPSYENCQKHTECAAITV